MYSQNVNLFKGNKSNSPSQVQIYQLHTPQPCLPPSFSNQAAQPLDLNYEQIKLIFQKLTANNVNLPVQNKFLLHLNQNKLLGNEQLQVLRQENNTLRKDSSEIKKLYEEQKLKYNQLKNLYKNGQSMFQMLEEKKTFLEKENKELRQILEKLYKQLHLKNYQFEDEENLKDKKAVQNKIRKVKIGNKKIPVIKVNVPPQTFAKKEHTNSVFSNVSGQQCYEINEEQLESYKQEIQRMHDTNKQLENELNEVKLELQECKKINKNIDKSHKEGHQKEDFMIKALKEQPLIKQRKSSTIQTIQNNGFNSTFGFQVSSFQNQSVFHSNSQAFSIYKENDSLSFFKSKYEILETELQKKDDALKSLYNQCYLLQAQINKLKSYQLQSVLKKQQVSKDIGQGWNKQKHAHHQQQFWEKSWKQREQREKGKQFQRRKINQLETKVNQLNQMCISNINQTFRINEQNDTITKLTRQNSTYQEKIMTLQVEISRLYKILENKNSQLSQIYTSITESKRNYPMDASKKKSFDNIFANTPQKLNQFSTTKIFYSKGHSKDNSFH